MAYRGADGVAAPCGSLLARPSTTAGDAGLPILATDMTACVPCLVVYVRSDCEAFTVRVGLRSLTKRLLTLVRSGSIRELPKPYESAA